MRISYLEPMLAVEPEIEEEIDLEIELDALHQDIGVVQPVSESSVEQELEGSLEDAIDESQESASFRLNDFINQYKKRMSLSENSAMDPRFRKAIMAYSYLDHREYSSTQVAQKLKKIA